MLSSRLAGCSFWNVAGSWLAFGDSFGSASRLALPSGYLGSMRPWVGASWSVVPTVSVLTALWFDSFVRSSRASCPWAVPGRR